MTEMRLKTILSVALLSASCNEIYSQPFRNQGWQNLPRPQQLPYPQQQQYFPPPQQLRYAPPQQLPYPPPPPFYGPPSLYRPYQHPAAPWQPTFQQYPGPSYQQLPNPFNSMPYRSPNRYAPNAFQQIYGPPPPPQLQFYQPKQPVWQNQPPVIYQPQRLLRTAIPFNVPWRQYARHPPRPPPVSPPRFVVRGPQNLPPRSPQYTRFSNVRPLFAEVPRIPPVQRVPMFRATKPQIDVSNTSDIDVSQGVEGPRSDMTTILPDDIDVLESQALLNGRVGRQLHFERGYENVDEDECPDGQLCRTTDKCEQTGGASTGNSCGDGNNYFCCDFSSNEIDDEYSNRTVPSDRICGRHRERTSRIVGGADAEFGEYPWQVFLRIGESRCGGAVLNRNFIITAAHCVKGKTKDDVTVILGELVLGEKVEELPHEIRHVEKILVHPNYADLSIDSHDVALLKIDRPLDFRANILPVCLPEPREDFDGCMAVVSGWGRKFPNHEYKANHLQAVKVPIIENSECKRWLRIRRKYAGIKTDHVCAGYAEGGKDACRGDSGGPLVAQREGKWFLVGLVSAGYSCSKALQPGIYHRVSSTVEWISQNAFSSEVS